MSPDRRAPLVAFAVFCCLVLTCRQLLPLKVNAHASVRTRSRAYGHGTRYQDHRKMSPAVEAADGADAEIHCVGSSCRKIPDFQEKAAYGVERLLQLKSAAAKIDNPQTRDAWIAKFAKSVPAGSRVLDVSAGARPYMHLWRHCEYFSHEFAGNTEIIDTFRGEAIEKSVTALRETHDFLGEIHNTTAPSNSFDVVILTEVLEHVPEPLRAIKELARVAKRGGHIIVTSPFTSGSHQQPYHFSSGYSPEFYQYAAKLYGLSVSEIASQGDYFKLMAQEIGRVLMCGGSVPGAEKDDVERLRTIASSYLLQLSALFGDKSGNKAACADQFTIGWMVHYIKK